VIITGSIDKLIEGKLSEDLKDFWIAKDWRDPFNSSVMYWIHGQQGRIYAAFQGQSDMARLRGDQNLIAEVCPDAKTFPMKDILSYKFDKVKDKPKCAKIVLFHGKPKMTDLPDVKWIKEEWK
jgi:hypothetical protein